MMDSKDSNGAIYAKVGDADGYPVARRLAYAMGLEPVPRLSLLAKAAHSLPIPIETSLYRVTEPPLKGLEFLSDFLSEVGKELKKEQKPPPIIIVDDINILVTEVKEDPQLKALQDMAKKLSDEKVLTMCFVDSGGLAFKSLTEKSAHTRMVVIDIPDLTEKQAKDYLRTTLKDREFTCKDTNDREAIIEMCRNKVDRDTRTCCLQAVYMDRKAFQLCWDTPQSSHHQG